MMTIKLRLVKQALTIGVGLISGFAGTHPVMAEPVVAPLITVSVTDCEKIYLVNLFEDGRVEYRGRWGVKSIGNRYSQINRSNIRALLNKFKEANIITTNGQVNSDAIKTEFYGVASALLIQYSGQQAAFYYDYQAPDTLIKLHEEIMYKTHADQWTGGFKPSLCYDKYGIDFKVLKNK